MSIIKVDYGEIGGGISLDPIFHPAPLVVNANTGTIVSGMTQKPKLIVIAQSIISNNGGIWLYAYEVETKMLSYVGYYNGVPQAYNRTKNESLITEITDTSFKFTNSVNATVVLEVYAYC